MCVCVCVRVCVCVCTYALPAFTPSFTSSGTLACYSADISTTTPSTIVATRSTSTIILGTHDDESNGGVKTKHRVANKKWSTVPNYDHNLALPYILEIKHV